MQYRTSAHRLAVGGGVLATLLLLLCPPLAAETTDPINLGSEGLTLTFRLYSWSGSAWVEADSSGISIDELGNGDYVAAGLPAATGSQRYRLIVATAGSPAAALAEYSWGARPGEAVVWRQDVSLPQRPLTFKVGDTAGQIALVVRSGLPATIAEANTTATLWDPRAGAAVVDDEAATISGVAYDATSASWGATLAYQLQEGDLGAPGRLLVEFRVCYPAGGCHRIPAATPMEISVVAAFGSGP